MGVFRLRISNPRDPLFLPVLITTSADQTETHRRRGRPLPTPVSTRLVLDSGSRQSCLSRSIVDHLQAPLVGRSRIHTATGVQPVDRFQVRLEFLPGTLKAIPKLRVAAIQVPAKLAGYGGVIGRDILDRWEFFWSGFRRRLTIRDYPSFWGWLFS